MRLLSLLLVACGSPSTSTSTKASTLASASASATDSAPVASAKPRPVLTPRPSSSSVTSASSAVPVTAGSSSSGALPFVLGAKTHDIATGSFVALGAVGAIVRKKDDSLAIVKLTDTPAPTRLDAADAAATYARTRSLVVDHDGTSFVYWVASSKLLRRSVDTAGAMGAVETLASDAEDGNTPSGVRVTDEGGTARDVVGYVAGRATKGRILHVWIEGQGVRGVGPEPLDASGVWAVSEGPGELSLLRIDQRAALAPVAVIRGKIAAGGEPTWGDDTMVWMAPSSDLISTVTAVHAGDSLVTLMATYQSGLSFGLATAKVIPGARPVDDATWLVYPNGLDPAPVLPLQICGRGVAAAVIPTDKPPTAPRALELLSLDTNGNVTGRMEVARAARIDHVATWNSPAGDGWIAWVGDGRTLVRSIRCGLSAKIKRP